MEKRDILIKKKNSLFLKKFEFFLTKTKVCFLKHYDNYSINKISQTMMAIY